MESFCLKIEASGGWRQEAVWGEALRTSLRAGRACRLGVRSACVSATFISPGGGVGCGISAEGEYSP